MAGCARQGETMVSASLLDAAHSVLAERASLLSVQR
jgi:hypothetical protein